MAAGAAATGHLASNRRREERMPSSRVTLRALSAGGAVTLVVGILAVTLQQRLYDAILDKKLELTPTSEGYSFWHTMPVPIFMKFYFWNVTNVEDVLAKTARPHLQELGPYVFSEKHLKVKMVWNDNGTVTYQQTKTWHYEPEMSVGSLDDNITTLNVPLLAAAAILEDLGPFLKVMFNEMVNEVNTTVFVSKSVRQFLFDGYDDPLLDAAQVLKHLVNVTIPFDKFGWFYGMIPLRVPTALQAQVQELIWYCDQRNNSDYYDGVFNMDTGRDVTQLGTLHFWNSTSKTSAFDFPCNMINGSAGELFHPRLDKSYIELYSTDICRSLRIPYKGPMSKYGLSGHRYQADHRLFATPDVTPDNWCFCTGGSCPPSGLLNETLCRFGVPAFVSFPHMLYANEHVRNETVGQEPNETLHNFHIDLEPETGVPLSVRARFQINMLLSPNPDVTIMYEVPTVYLPMLWFDNAVDTTPEIASQFVTIVQTVPLAMSAGSYALLALGVALLVAAGLLLAVVRARRPAAGEEPLTGANSSDNSLGSPSS